MEDGFIQKQKLQYITYKMKELDLIKDSIIALPVITVPMNAWENKKYKPYAVKLVELDKVLQILQLIEEIKLK